MARKKIEEQDEQIASEEEIKSGSAPVANFDVDRSVTFVSVTGDVKTRFPDQFKAYKVGDAIDTREYSRLVAEGEKATASDEGEDSIKAAQKRSLASVKSASKASSKSAKKDESEETE